MSAALVPALEVAIYEASVALEMPREAVHGDVWALDEWAWAVGLGALAWALWWHVTWGRAWWRWLA
jgi:hypothetical protein